MRRKKTCLHFNTTKCDIQSLFSTADAEAKADGKAKRLNISARLSKTLENELNVCAVLANGLENALHACTGVESPKISGECNRYVGKVVIQIKNLYAGQADFVDGLPKRECPGQRLGTKSMVPIAESRGGGADFSAENGVATLSAVF